jgi:hypothetical protein
MVFVDRPIKPIVVVKRGDGERKKASSKSCLQRNGVQCHGYPPGERESMAVKLAEI